MSLFDEALVEIDKGYRGEAVRIPTGFNKLDDILSIGQKMYTLVGGMSGTGKTSFVDQAYVLSPYAWYIANKETSNIKLKIIYRSMERSKSYKIAKWITERIFVDKGLIVDVALVLGWHRKSKMSQETYDLVKTYRNYFEEMEDVVEIISGPENPTGIYNHAVKYAWATGTYFKAVAGEYVESTKGDKIYFSDDIYRLDSTGNKVFIVTVEAYGKRYELTPYSELYVPSSEDRIVELVTDHVGNLKKERRDNKVFTEKENLDKHSEYGRILRDTYWMSPLNISQFNRGLEDTIRRTKTDLSPLPSDFKGSGNMYEDCDVAMGLFNPYKLKDFAHMGYKIDRFVTPKGENRFRSVTILKNSYGVDDVAYGYNFIGENGHFIELPTAKEIGEDYSPYLFD